MKVRVVPGATSPVNGLCQNCLLPGLLIATLYAVCDDSIGTVGTITVCEDCRTIQD